MSKEVIRTIENTEVCPCGIVFVDADDYDTLGSVSGVCCPSCGNEKFQTIKALLKQQPAAGELLEEAVALDKMCVSEIVAKYESSHNAITVLKRKLREACESDEWMKSATEFYENGGCPICFSTDEEGCKEGCYLGQLRTRLDTAEALNKDLVDALEEIRDLETECCPRCEGNGRLYADGKAHHVSENADTIFCGNCGGSGRILPDNAQEIAEATIAKAQSRTSVTPERKDESRPR